jgi:hypothetical protein
VTKAHGTIKWNWRRQRHAKVPLNPSTGYLFIHGLFNDATSKIRSSELLLDLASTVIVSSPVGVHDIFVRKWNFLLYETAEPIILRRMMGVISEQKVL